MTSGRDLGLKIANALALCVGIAVVSEAYFGARDGFVVAFDIALVGALILSVIEGAHKARAGRSARQHLDSRSG